MQVAMMPTWDPSNQLRSWLRKTPKPARVRIRTEDGEERMLELSADLRGRWKSLEETVVASGARVVECLDEKGAVIRGKQLHFEDDDDAAGASPDAQRRADDKLISRERRELGGLLEAYGRQLNSAFDRGASAANTGQENLVNLVETLTTHLSLAITNLHNASVNLANMVQSNGGEAETGNGALLERVIAGALARPVTAVPAEAPNGKGRKP